MLPKSQWTEKVAKEKRFTTKIKCGHCQNAAPSRVLDFVCEDRQASGDTLDKKLKSLAGNGEIPSKLVDVAAGIRKLRNIGAHANLGELTEAELPVLGDLTRAILEYVYSAPSLAAEAEARLASLKSKTAR